MPLCGEKGLYAYIYTEKLIIIIRRRRRRRIRRRTYLKKLRRNVPGSEYINVSANISS
jgi:hypothetical protein